MRRLFHILLNAALVLSLLLCMAMAFVWARGHFIRDYAWVWLPWLRDDNGQRHLWLCWDSQGGQLQLSVRVWNHAMWTALRRNQELANRPTYWRTFDNPAETYSRSTPSTLWNGIGFKLYHASDHTSIYLPFWFLCFALAMAPGAALFLRRRAMARRRRRRELGLCVACGYDMRATPQRCPECGASSG